LLSKNGINVTLADYDRISCVLSAGGEWNLEWLRGSLLALLVKDREHEATFNRCFDSFFAANLPEYPPEEIKKIRSQITAKDPEPPPKPTPDYSNALLTAVGIITILVIVVVVIKFPWGNIVPKPPPLPTPTPTPVPPFARVAAMGIRPPLIEPWPLTVLILVALGLTVYFFWWAWKRDKSDYPAVPETYKGKPHYFSLKDVGSAKLNYLSSTVLDELASSLRHVLSEARSKRLDAKASVNASGRRAGYPTLIYQRDKHVRRVNIWIDAATQALKWNTTPQELAHGLVSRGIEVAVGEFYGRPLRFKVKDGGVVWLSDLESYQPYSLNLFFSDGKRLNYKRDKATLETIARMPLTVWFDFREPKFWDAGARLVHHFKIPIYPADEDGIVAGVARALNESSLMSEEEAGRDDWIGVREGASRNLPSQIEDMLGDAMAWAQACAMMQPLPLKLANSVRVRFQPNLPPQRIERLIRLPGSWLNTAGLVFSRPVLSILRGGFSFSWESEEQEEILKFLIDEIEMAEPPEKDSLRHVSWRWTRERIRLELDPDAALREIAELLSTPLQIHIKSELAATAAPGESLQQLTNKIPLRVPPATRQGKRRLARIKTPPSIPLTEIAFRAAEAGMDKLNSLRVARLLEGIIATLFEFAIYFPYYESERDVAGYLKS